MILHSPRDGSGRGASERGAQSGIARMLLAGCPEPWQSPCVIQQSHHRLRRFHSAGRGRVGGRLGGGALVVTPYSGMGPCLSIADCPHRSRCCKSSRLWLQKCSKSRSNPCRRRMAVIGLAPVPVRPMPFGPLDPAHPCALSTISIFPTSDRSNHNTRRKHTRLYTSLQPYDT